MNKILLNNNKVYRKNLIKNIQIIMKIISMILIKKKFFNNNINCNNNNNNNKLI